MKEQATSISKSTNRDEHGGRVDGSDLSLQAAKRIRSGLRQARASRKFVVIIGPSGLGKSLVLRYFSNGATRGNMHVVEAYDGMTPRAFLSSICAALGETATGSVSALIERAARTLAEQPWLLAVDGANFLEPQSVNHLVYIWNKARIGIVLLGTGELEQIVRDSDYERIQSRLQATIQL